MTYTPGAPNYRVARTARRASAVGGGIVSPLPIGTKVRARMTEEGALHLDVDGEARVVTMDALGFSYYVAPDCLEPIAPAVEDEQLAKGFAAIGLPEVTVEKIAAARKVAEIVAEVTA